MESLNNFISLNNSNILIQISNTLENIVNNLSNDGQRSAIIKQIKNIIIILNKINNDNQKYINLVRKDIKSLENNISLNFNKLFKHKEIPTKNNDYITVTENYEGGDKYIGQMKNGFRNGKGIYYYKNGAKYEGIGKTIFHQGKEFIIIKMEINMKVILKMVQLKEKEFIII